MMYLDLRVYLLVSKHNQGNFTHHIVYTQSIHFVQSIRHSKSMEVFSLSPWKYFPYTLNTYATTSQDGTVQEECDCTVSYTRASVSFISL